MPQDNKLKDWLVPPIVVPALLIVVAVVSILMR